MSRRTLISLAASVIVGILLIATVSTDAFARRGGGGGRAGAGVHHGGVHHGAVHRGGVYRGAAVRRGVADGACGGVARGVCYGGAGGPRPRRLPSPPPGFRGFARVSSARAASAAAPAAVRCPA